MPKITIDEIEYHTEDLSDYGKQQLISLQFLEGQMQKIKSELVIYETAKEHYIQVLKTEIEVHGVKPISDQPLNSELET